MTAFKTAFDKTMQREGHYSNDPVDPGGETYMGISRVFWPNWPGWDAVNSGIDPQINSVEFFYRENFWNRFQGEAVAAYSPVVAARLFDVAVNLGVHRAGKYLQTALNLLNNNRGAYPDLLVDGVVGKITIGYLALFFQRKPPEDAKKEKMLLNVIRTLQGQHYVDQMTKYPERERFRGWFLRL